MKGNGDTSKIDKILHSHYSPTGSEIPKGTYSGAPRKMQRNDPCFCGSGKKLKKCCIKKRIR